MKEELIQDGVRLILQGLEVDPDDRNYKDTPKRFSKMMREMFIRPTPNFPTFADHYSGIILARNHVIYTLCPHHLALVDLRIDMAYLPTSEVYGLSKLGRIADSLNTKPLLQEEFTRLLGLELDKIPGCRGAAVVVTGNHGCMRVRGLKTSGDVITSTHSGEFSHPEVWNNFLTLRKG